MDESEKKERKQFKAEQIGKVLRAYRKDRGLEISDVGLILEEQYGLKVKEKTIYNWESGQYFISTKPLMALIDY